MNSVRGKLAAGARVAVRQLVPAVAWITVFILVSRVIYFHLGATQYVAGQEPDDYFHVVLRNSGSIDVHRWQGLKDVLEAQPDWTFVLPEGQHRHEFGSWDGSGHTLEFEAVAVEDGQRVEVRYDTGDYVFRSAYRVERGTILPESMHTGHAMTAGAAAFLGLIATLVLRLVFLGARGRSGTARDTTT